MARATHGSGPWGEALQYWLVKRNWTQMDLVRTMNRREKRGTKVQPNSISRIARGFHTKTAFLARIAAALEIPLVDLLVSPTQRLDDQTRLRLVTQVTQRVLYEMERHAGQPDRALGEQLAQQLESALPAEEQVPQPKKRKR